MFYNDFVPFAKTGVIFAMLRQDRNLGDSTILLKMEWQFSIKNIFNHYLELLIVYSRLRILLFVLDLFSSFNNPFLLLLLFFFVFCVFFSIKKGKKIGTKDVIDKRLGGFIYLIIAFKLGWVNIFSKG